MKKIAGVAILIPAISFAQIQYPITRTVDQRDDYHGTTVSDPYRWLEDDHSPETRAWIEAENKVTFDYLAKVPFRKKMTERLEQVYDYAKYSTPFRKGGYYYFYKNDGLQNQSVLYRQLGLSGVPEVVIDPNQLSVDGTTRLVDFVVARDGRHAAYAVSKAGSDWQEIYVMDMHTLRTAADHIAWVKASGISWQGDGFYYSRYPEPRGGAELCAKNEYHQVYYHTIGEAQERDRLIYEDKKNPQRFHYASTTEDERYVILSISDRGQGLDGNALYYKTRDAKEFTPIVADITNDQYSVIDNDDTSFIISTNAGAQNYKVDRYDMSRRSFCPLVPEQRDPLENAAAAGGKLFLSYLHDVSARVCVYSTDGKFENEVALPGIGTVGAFIGERDDTDVFYLFTSFTIPPTIYRYIVADGRSELFRRPEARFDATAYETRQVFYTSRDGTHVPMFIVYKKGLALTGSNPTLLYAYGGFNISLTPAFSPLLIPFLDAGGVYAQPNLRGGGEYGEAWHEQGMKLKKQNVFDDFIAAAEYLISERYTSSRYLAIRGGSNGGLLVGAVMNQRPELFRVAIPQVGVMDMLRFQRFTIGWNWIADYGTSDSVEDFHSLYRFSPLHNIRAGVAYPATLVTTADHDDRVVPAHSFKYIAARQAIGGRASPSPLLIRIDINSGHGASNTRKNIETMADIYSFIFYNMGITPQL